MPPATAAEKAEAVEAPPAPPPRKGLFSAGGYVVLLVILVVEGILVFTAARYFGQGGGPTAAIDTKVVVVDLGQVRRSLASGDAANMVTDTFMVKVGLVISSKLENVPEVQAAVEARRDWLKSKVYDIISDKPEADLRKPNALTLLREELKERLNKHLGAGKGGQEVIEEVIFPDRELPPRR